MTMDEKFSKQEEKEREYVRLVHALEQQVGPLEQNGFKWERLLVPVCLLVVVLTYFSCDVRA